MLDALGCEGIYFYAGETPRKEDKSNTIAHKGAAAYKPSAPLCSYKLRKDAFAS